MGDVPNEIEVRKASLAATLAYDATELMALGDVSDWPISDFEIKIENEIIGVGTRSGNTFSSLARGSQGEGRVHPFSADVLLVITGETLAEASGITDDVIEFANVDTPGPLVPIVAVDQDAESITVAGDLSRYAISEGPNISVTGSSGNDGSYSVSEADYDPDSDQTTVILDDGELPSPVADGSVQFPALIEYDVVIAPGGAIEWVLVLLEEEWAADSAYLWVGPVEDIAGYINLAGLHDHDPGDLQGIQWPIVTLSDLTNEDTPQWVSSISAIGTIAPPTRHSYDYFPDGGTIRAFVLVQGGSNDGGRTRVIVHHHFDVARTAAIVPVA